MPHLTSIQFARFEREVDMRYFARAERVLALLLTSAVGTFGLPAFAGASPALVSGTILRTGSGDPVKGAVLKLAHRPDSKIFESARTDAKGRYSLSGLPSGSYDLAVETDGGLYLVGAPFALQPGERRTMSLSVRPE